MDEELQPAGDGRTLAGRSALDIAMVALGLFAGVYAAAALAIGPRPMAALVLVPPVALWAAARKWPSIGPVRVRLAFYGIGFLVALALAGAAFRSGGSI